MKILVAGATGNIGSRILSLLLADGQSVAAAVRNVSRAWERLRIPDLDYRQLDFSDPATWETALREISRMFLVVPPGSATAEQVAHFFAAAKQAGVEHLVFSSGRTTGDIEGTPLNLTETLVQNSGMGWTILRPGWFMQNFINWVGFTIPTEGKLLLPAANARTAFVDVRDIAAVAAHILIQPDGHHGKRYEITSNEALSHAEVATKISEVAGQSVQYIPLSEESFVKEMAKRGWSVKAAEKAAWLYSFVREGKEAEVSHDVELVLGRPPIRFQQFVRGHAEAFRKQV